MDESPLDIDRIVREVIAELGAGAAPDVGRIANPSHDDLPRQQDTLVVDCRVVTMSEVSGRLEEVRRLVVPRRAVITPAVRDELQRRNVCLEFAPPPHEAADRVRLVLVTAGRRFDPSALIRGLGPEAIEVESHRSDCLIAATDLLAGEVANPETLGLLLAREVAAALCLANRHRGVRAVSAADATAVATAAAAVGANLLVIDPAAAGSHRLKEMAAEFCRGGARECPEVFRKQLA